MCCLSGLERRSDRSPLVDRWVRQHRRYERRPRLVCRLSHAQSARGPYLGCLLQRLWRTSFEPRVVKHEALVHSCAPQSYPSLVRQIERGAIGGDR